MVAATRVEVDTPHALETLGAISDPIRFQVVQLLTTGTHCVCELQAHVPIAANLLSYHLKVLRDIGLVTTSRRGRWVDYTLAEDALDRLHAAIPRPSDPEGSAP